MNDDIDRALHHAFHDRPVPTNLHASLTEVRSRARRRQQRRVVGTVGAVTLTSVGTVALLAHRTPGADPAPAGIGDGGLEATTTTICFPATTVEMRTTTFPPNTLPPTTAAFDASNYSTTTTVIYDSAPSDAFGPCGEAPIDAWHCTNPLGVDESGGQVFLTCEQWPDVNVATTVEVPGTAVPTTNVEPIPTSTTSVVESSVLDSTTTSLG